MHAVSSDDEVPDTQDEATRFDPRIIRKRIKKQAKRYSSVQLEDPKRVSKRTKKIIKKLRREALDCDDYDRCPKRLIDLQQLIEKERVSLVSLNSYRKSGENLMLSLKPQILNLTKKP